VVANYKELLRAEAYLSAFNIANIRDYQRLIYFLFEYFAMDKIIFQPGEVYEEKGWFLISLF